MEESKDKPHAPGVVRKVKKRKRPPKHNCDKNCSLCRIPCDSPINPQAVRKLTQVTGDPDSWSRKTRI